MKIEIPGYGPVDIEELKTDAETTIKQNLSGFKAETVLGLINKIKELQSDIESLESELDIALDAQPII